MRLIDADALIDALGISDEDIVFEAILEDEPTVDAVQVVRCGDCLFCHRFANDSNSSIKNWCLRFLPKQVNDDDFCKWGERKDNEID